LRRWWRSAASTVVTQTWESRFWVLIGVIGVVHDPLSNSVPVIFFMSAWANVKGAKNEAQGAKREMIEEQAEEAEEE
jgi:hypothetical protein